YAQNDSAAYYYAQGMTEKQARRFREAEKNFVKANQFSPNKFETLVGLANVLVEQNRYTEARTFYLKADQLNSQDTMVIEQLAVISLNVRNWADAQKYAQKMLQMKIGKQAGYIL